MDEQDIILVNDKDEAIGVMDKLQVHQQGLLHRAFSVFIFDKNGRMLLQQRSGNKYHGALLWTNACCSHPYPGEALEVAVQRRLFEELGFVTPVKKLFVFTYHAPVENDLIEHEIDHVFAGEYDGEIPFNEDEVASVASYDMQELKMLLQQEPGKFTSWFKIAFPKVEDWWAHQYSNKITS